MTYEFVHPADPDAWEATAGPRVTTSKTFYERLTAGDISVVTDAYVECADWADHPRTEDGACEDSHGWADETLREAREFVVSFVSDAALSDALTFWRDTFGLEQIGHDMWLTRNHHGAGFWDRDYSEPGASHGRKLTTAVQAYGGCDLYVGDDGWTHAQ